MAADSKKTPAKIKKFLDSLRENGNVSKAAQAAKVSRQTPYNWAAEDEDFKAEWEEAEEEGVDRIEEEAYRRAVYGVEEPLHHQGHLTGHTVQKYSDTLLIFMLKSKRREVYGDKVDTNLNIVDPISDAADKFEREFMPEVVTKETGT